MPANYGQHENSICTGIGPRFVFLRCNRCRASASNPQHDPGRADDKDARHLFLSRSTTHPDPGEYGSSRLKYAHVRSEPTPGRHCSVPPVSLHGCQAGRTRALGSVDTGMAKPTQDCTLNACLPQPHAIEGAPVASHPVVARMQAVWQRPSRAATYLTLRGGGRPSPSRDARCPVSSRPGIRS